MKFYRDSNGKVRGFESDGSQDHLIPEGLMLMTAAEVEAHINPSKTAEMVCGECSAYMVSILAVGFTYSGSTYQITGDAQDSIGKRAIYAGWSTQDPIKFPWVEPYSRGWWDITNTWHSMSAEEFLLFAKAVSDYVSMCDACCRDHKNAITPENCSTYDYTLNWPVI